MTAPDAYLRFAELCHLIWKSKPDISISIKNEYDGFDGNSYRVQHFTACFHDCDDSSLDLVPGVRRLEKEAGSLLRSLPYRNFSDGYQETARMSARTNHMEVCIEAGHGSVLSRRLTWTNDLPGRSEDAEQSLFFMEIPAGRLSGHEKMALIEGGFDYIKSLTMTAYRLAEAIDYVKDFLPDHEGTLRQMRVDICHENG